MFERDIAVDPLEGIISAPPGAPDPSSSRRSEKGGSYTLRIFNGKIVVGPSCKNAVELDALSPNLRNIGSPNASRVDDLSWSSTGRATKALATSGKRSAHQADRRGISRP